MKISKLLAEFLLVRACEQNDIDCSLYDNLTHENVSVINFYQYDTGAIRFTVIIDTIGVLSVLYRNEDFDNGICFHRYVVGEEHNE